MKVQKQILHNCLAEAKSFYKLGEKDKARDQCDLGIGFVASKRITGYGAKDTIEGIRVELWLERFWMFLENKNLLL
jgi:hypothetical protein|tara:strand:+ start:191 stop:418 length:228 start_codon:yes stop_codon:yes gene_type:complete